MFYFFCLKVKNNKLKLKISSLKDANQFFALIIKLDNSENNIWIWKGRGKECGIYHYFFLRTLDNILFTILVYLSSVGYFLFEVILLKIIATNKRISEPV